MLVMLMIGALLGLCSVLKLLWIVKRTQGADSFNYKVPTLQKKLQKLQKNVTKITNITNVTNVTNFVIKAVRPLSELFCIKMENTK